MDKQERMIEEITAALVPAVRHAVLICLREHDFTPRNQNETDDRMLNIQEAADFLQVTSAAIRAWVRKGVLVPRRVGSDMRFLRSELLDWTAGKSDKPKLKAIK
jgi:excisionase family DNA binding protein